jgi:co-chaperonin GroES (HSP10)
MAAATARKTVVESLVTNQNQVDFSFKDLAEAFPDVDPGMAPFGTIGIFQIRQAKTHTAGGLELPNDVRQTEHYNTQVAKVIALGPLAFMREVDGELLEWPEGRWFKVGDYVRVPKFGGDRFSMPFQYQSDRVIAGRLEKTNVKSEVIFALFRVKDVLGKITGDPLKIKAFLD